MHAVEWVLFALILNAQTGEEVRRMPLQRFDDAAKCLVARDHDAKVEVPKDSLVAVYRCERSDVMQL